MLVVLKEAKISHEKVTTLSDVNFTVDEGEFVYLIGKVGSGKSSILKTLYAELPLGGGTGEVLGYNLAMLSGTDDALELAIAANLYSKTIPAAMNYILVYYQKHQRTLPPVLQQAVLIAANDNEGVMQYFPGVVEAGEPQMYSFYTLVKPIIEERNAKMAGKSEAEQEAIRHEYNARLRKELKADWLGTYYYYYFCENVDDYQEKPHEKSGVN